MKVYSWQDILTTSYFLLPTVAATAATIGGFDGMHLGHQALFDAVFDYKKSHPSVQTGVITFSRSPAVFKIPKYNGDAQAAGFATKFQAAASQIISAHATARSADVTTKKLKLEFFEQKGFDFCIMIDFSLDFSKIKGRDFLDTVRKFCSMQFLAAGSDFRCGHNSDTGVAELSDYCTRNGLELKVLDDVIINEKRVSSSLVRGAVQNSDFDFAKQLLGRPYCLDGTVLDFHSEHGSSDAKLTMIADRKTTQALPERGTFPVRVFAGGSSYMQNIDAALHVESSFLRLEFPLEQKIPSVEKIEFI